MSLPTTPTSTPSPTHPAASRPTGRRSLRRFLRPYRGSLSLASGLILVETLIDLARPWPLKLAVDNAIGGQPLDGPLAMLDGLGPGGVAAVAVGAGIGLVGVGALVGYLITYLTSATAERVGAGLREAVFGRMLGLGLPFHDRHRSGDLVTRLTGDVARVEDSMVAWFTVLVPEVLTLVGMVVVVLAVDLALGLAALAVVPPLALVVALRRRRIRVAQRVSRDADAALASEATEVLRNVRVVQAFTREGEAGGHFSGRSRRAVRAALGAMDLEARWSPVADLLLAAGGGLVLWLGVSAVTSGQMSLGTLLVVLAYLSSLYGPIRALARLARTLARGAASRERVLEVLDSGEVVPEAAAPLPAGPPRNGLALRGVWFGYAEGATVLRHLDLEVAAGERVCVVGPTGAGKSTLLALLLRFYDPDAGTIELDGTDLRDLELGSLRRQLALVPQDPWMLDGTIADNIAFGRSSRGVRGGGLPPEWTGNCKNECRQPPHCVGWRMRTPRSGRAGCGWPGGSGGGSRWLGRCSGTPRCCCWTNQPAGWTRPLSGRCSTPSTWPPRGGRCCRCRTASAWPPGPTGWWSSTAAGWSSRALPASCWPPAAPTRGSGPSSIPGSSR
jgi:ATP-binding cassette subfamily B protein